MGFQARRGQNRSVFHKEHCHWGEREQIGKGRRGRRRLQLFRENGTGTRVRVVALGGISA